MPPTTETRPFLRHIFSEVTGSERSQTTQKIHDIWLPGPPSFCPLRAAPSQRCQRALLCCEVDLDVDVGGIKRHVSEPSPDRIDVDACLQQVGGGRMTDDMGTDPPAMERRQRGTQGRDVTLDECVNAVSCEWLAPPVQEQSRLGRTLPCQPTKLLDGRIPERATALLGPVI